MAQTPFEEVIYMDPLMDPHLFSTSWGLPIYSETTVNPSHFPQASTPEVTYKTGLLPGHWDGRSC